MKISTLTVFAFAVLAFRLGVAAQLPKPSELTITHHARSLQPGEVVLLTVESRKALRSATGFAFGKGFPLFAGRSNTVWQGLIGIDPDVKAGRFTIWLDATCMDGAQLESDHVLDVRSKIFPTRRLTVEEKYVTPPKDMEERIRLESQLVEKAFARLTPVRLWMGSFVVPVPAPPTSSFGRRTILNGRPRSPHWGTDFTAAAGTPVVAPNSGRIILAGDLYFSGNTIIIDHGLGLYSYLAHMSEIAVRQGDEVKAGALVGRVGATGRATGPHLHWTVRLVGVRVDPLSLIAALSGTIRGEKTLR